VGDGPGGATGADEEGGWLSVGDGGEGRDRRPKKTATAMSEPLIKIAVGVERARCGVMIGRAGRP
jgi:hypothetical protein